ncbi:MAG TPA: Xaa-Pro peptidase family protein [Pirellulales bacterium]|jgi:Xaa-Pro aminopeptidase|nr:Xaa-Pro peptidase family protein [Pirellulales bacterium]
MDRFRARCDKLRKSLAKAGADGLLVTNFVNVTYLTGFTGDDSFLLVTPKHAILLSDPRYTTQIEEECGGIDVEIRSVKMNMLELVARAVERAGPKQLAVEADSITLGLADRIANKLPKVGLVPLPNLVERQRMVKDKEEVAEIRRAIDQAQRAFAVLRASIRPEQTEKEVADNLEHQMRLFGAKGASFPSIIAVGPRAALPHARPTAKRIGESEFVLVDWGADSLYKSDLTRVLVTGKIPPKLERVYGVVLKAQLAGIEAIRPGVSCQDVDSAARKVIEDAGFGRQFGHGLGHGIGLDIHEGPRLGQGQKHILESGMVVTVEPGIYLPGWGGVRIEDDVLVTKGGHEVLTNVPKQWSDACLV